MFAKALISLALLVALSAPMMAFATPPPGLVPCGTETTDPCGFNDIIKLAKNIINFLIGLGVVAAALGFAYAGFLYITAMGSEEKIKHAHAIFLKVIWGFVFMLSAWLIVKTLENAFLTTDQQERSFLKSTPVTSPGTT